LSTTRALAALMYRRSMEIPVPWNEATLHVQACRLVLVVLEANLVGLFLYLNSLAFYKMI
jgi:hypothetical protein